MTDGAPSPSPAVLDREAIRAVDRAAIERYGIPGVILMENAARGLLAAAQRMLAGQPRPARALILCGAGNNGGDGYALARHLTLDGHDVLLVPAGEPAPGSDARINREICRRMRIAETTPEALDEVGPVDLVVDALLGTGLTRDVGGLPARLIAWINAADAPVLAVDVPSGLDCDRGVPLGDAVRADVTVTFVAAKPGLVGANAAPYVGDLVVAGIGAPVSAPAPGD